MNFDGKFSQWLETLKQTFSDHMQMKGVINIFRNDGKRSVKSIRKSKSFYAAALKLLIPHLGNAFYVSHVKLNEMFDQPKIKANLIAIRYFNEKVKFINT